MSNMELTEKEKDLLQVYLIDFMAAREKMGLLQASLINLQKMALFARGFSPETHSIDDKGIIHGKPGQPIQPDEKNKDAV